MELQTRDRVRLIGQLVDEMGSDDRWEYHRIDTVLRAYGLKTIQDSFHQPGYLKHELSQNLSEANDSDLGDLYGCVFDVEPADVLGRVSVSDGSGLWLDGHVRVFISHVAAQKKYAATVSEILSRRGIQGFVAHESIEPTKQWQAEIERALNTADAFVALVHPTFTTSFWTNQEIGWAYGRRMPSFFVRLGEDPVGFPAGTQWRASGSETQTAQAIAEWLNSQDSLSHKIGGALLTALRNAGSYKEAETVALDLDQFGRLTPNQVVALDEIVLTNNQVGQSVIARRALEPVYQRHARPFPVHPPF